MALDLLLLQSGDKLLLQDGTSRLGLQTETAGTSVPVFAYHYAAQRDAIPMWLKQSTAGQEVPLGPFVDSTDGSTAETALSIANTDIKVWKSGATSEVNKNSGGATHIASGRYYAVLDATDSDTLGPLELNIAVSGALPVKLRCMVLAANVYDSLVAASDKLEADVAQFGGTNGTFSGGRPEVNTSHAAGTAWNSGAIGASTLASDTLTAAKVATDAVEEIRNAITGGAYDLDTDANGRIRIVDGTGTGELDTSSGTVLLRSATQASIDAIEADTNELETDWSDGGRLDLILDARASQTSVDDLPTNAELATALAAADDAVLAAVAALNDLSAADINTAMVNAGLVLNSTTIATLASQTSFTLTAGSTDNNAYNGCVIVVTDSSTAVQKAVGVVSGYTGSSKTITLLNDPAIFTMAAGDAVDIIPCRALKAAIDNRTLSIESDGMAHADLKEWLGSAPNSLSSGLVQVALSAAGLATDAAQEIRDAITGGAYALSTDSNGRVRIVDGTGAGELDTTSGHVTLADASLVTAKLGTFALAKTTNITGFNDLSAAQVNSEVDTAIADVRLDELLAADSDIDGAAPPTVGSVFHELMSKSAGSFTFDQTTDALEAIRDRGDAAWATATGFSTHSAADVWAVATRILTAGTNIALAKGTGVTGFTDIDAAGVRAAVGLASANLDTQIDALPTANEVRNAVTGGAYALDTDANGRVRIVDGTGTGELDTSSGTVLLRAATEAEIDAILTDTNELQTDWANGGRLDLLLDLAAATLTAAGVRSAVGLASANLDTQLDALPTAAENAAALLDLTDGIETGVTPRKAIRAIAAKAAGLISGAGTGTEVVKGIGQASGGTTRLTATVDSSGNISAWTLNL